MSVAKNDPREPHDQREPVGRQLARRWAAAGRLALLPDGRRDPLQPPRTAGPHQRDLDAWDRALTHLAGLGLPGLAPADVHRALAARPTRRAA